MHRRLLVWVVAVGFAVSGAMGLTTCATEAAASTPSSRLPPSPVEPPFVAPTMTPSPVDVIAPVTTASGMGSRWRNDTATVTFTATDDQSGVAATVFRVDEGSWTVGMEVQVRAPKDHSNDGVHAVEFYSVDNARNVETPQTVLVKIDTRPPRFAWKSVSPAIIHRVQPVSCRFTIVEDCGPVALSYRVTDQYGYPAVGKSGLQRGEGTQTVRIMPRYRSGKGFVPGVYRIQFKVRDEAGNVLISKRRSFRNHRVVGGGVWRRVGGAGRVVALTFDDGNHAAWASILTTLKRHRMHATFFPLGPYVASGASLARRTMQEGHACGVHGWTHATMTRLSASQIQSEWQRNAAAWWSATGCSPVPYCRPPYGAVSSGTISASAAIGFFRVILWDVDPQDWAQPGVGVIASRVLSSVRAGSIVCMHLTPQTAQALPAILSGLRSRGYKAVSLPEMFHAAGMR